MQIGVLIILECKSKSDTMKQASRSDKGAKKLEIPKLTQLKRFSHQIHEAAGQYL